MPTPDNQPQTVWDAEYSSTTTQDRQPTEDFADIQPLVTAQRNESYAEFLTTAVSQKDRNVTKKLEQARHVGALLARSAFYSFPAGGGSIEGPSIDLAYALAQVWGYNVTRVAIVATEGNRCRLRGIYVDLQNVSIFERDYEAHLSPAPGKFANKPDQADRWRVMQMQAASSKAVRGAILAGLPAWLVDAAMDAARDAAANRATGGLPLPEARRNAVEHFKSLGLTVPEIEDFVGQPVDLWTANHLGDLRELAAGLKSGRVAVEQIKAGFVASQTQEAAPKATTGREDLGLGGKATSKGTGAKGDTTKPPKAAAKAETKAETKPEAAKPVEREPGSDDEDPNPFG